MTNGLVGIAYELGVGVISFILARRIWRHDRELAWVFVGLVLMASSCGPHHQHLAAHFLFEGLTPAGPDVAAIVVALPFGAAWLYWQFNTVTGRGHQDWRIDGAARWPSVRRGVLCVYTVAIVTAAWSGFDVATGQGAEQLALLVLYCVIGYLLWTGQFRRRRIDGHWSGKGIALACIFPTCAVEHAAYGLAVASGRYPSDAHSGGELWIDGWGIAVAVFFIVVTIRQRRAAALVDADEYVRAALLADALAQAVPLIEPDPEVPLTP